MSLTQFLVSYKGRIRRLHWWVASLSAGATSLITAVPARSSGHAAVDPDTQHVEATGLLGLAVLAVRIGESLGQFRTQRQTTP
jgi:uncharacterized membrane protein YhaH (DUF805 family)